MPKELDIANKKILITTRSNAKKLTLRVNKLGQIKLTIPRFTSRLVYKKFVRENLSWIDDQLQNRAAVSKEDAHTDYLRHKHSALALVKNRLDYFNEHYKFSYNRISVKNQSTRWGSCSAKKNLNFNYRIIHLPETLADYIVVHELCHLKELNHSKEFWDLVSDTLPNHRSLRKQLRNFAISDF